MASFVVHRSRLGARPSADGDLGCPCAKDQFSRNKEYMGHRPFARRREQTRYKTNMVWAYPTYKENEMKRIGALHGMGWLVLSLIFQTSYVAAVAAQEINEAQLTSPANGSLDYWTGRLEQDTTWRDTVYVGGDVTIASGATLTLAPDTQVHFMPYRDDTQGGLDSTRAELIVEGRLHAQAEGIVFCSANDASLGADWYGIVVEPDGLADVSNATIRDGLRCLYAKRGGYVRMDHVAFANCGRPSGASLALLSHRATDSESTQVDAGRASGQLKLRDQSAQAELGIARSDSLSEHMEAMVKRYYTKATNRDALRIAKKVAAGTASGIVFTVISFGVLGEVLVDDSYSDDGLEAVGLLFVSLYAGNLVGFPLGMSKVDPHDSLGKTLLGSGAAGLGGLGLVAVGAIMRSESLAQLGFMASFVAPPIVSIAVSEKSRKPPQARRVSVGLSSTLNGGLSAVAQLNF